MANQNTGTNILIGISLLLLAGGAYFAIKGFDAKKKNKEKQKEADSFPLAKFNNYHGKKDFRTAFC